MTIYILIIDGEIFGVYYDKSLAEEVLLDQLLHEPSIKESKIESWVINSYKIQSETPTVQSLMET